MRLPAPDLRKFMSKIPLEKENLRILITRTDRIGDLVLSTAVFPELRRHFPKAHLAALIFAEHRAILDGNPYLDEVILYDKKKAQRGLIGNWKFARMLAVKKFDVVIHLHATNRMHAAAWIAKIPVRIGWDRRLPQALTHVFRDTKKEGKKHEAAYNFQLLEPLGIQAPVNPELYFPVPAAAEEKAGKILKESNLSTDRPLVLLSPGASCVSKRWPAERFARLADALAFHFHGNPAAPQFAVIGSEADRPLAAKILSSVQAPVLDLCGRLGLSELGALMKKSALLISNDSGPVHIAAALGTPVISIFGRRQPGLSPERWRPLGPDSRFIWKDTGCEPCLAHECRINFLCLDIVSAGDVLNLAVPLLSGRAPKSAKHA